MFVLWAKNKLTDKGRGSFHLPFFIKEVSLVYSVYVFLDDLNRPYYVGKTSNMTKRRKDHLFELKTRNMLPKYRKARQLYRGKGHPFKMRRIRTAKTEAEAFRLERLYIKRYRKAGYQLMNCTWGGPDEKPMKINKPQKLNKKGLVFKKANKKKRT